MSTKSKLRYRRPKGRHVGVLHDMIDSAAFEDASSQAVKLWLYIARKHNGWNNGDIAFSCREAAAVLKLKSPESGRKYLNELVRLGLLIRVKRGGFTVRAPQRDGHGIYRRGNRSTIWQLPDWPTRPGEAAPKNYLNYKRSVQAENFSPVQSRNGHDVQSRTGHGPQFRETASSKTANSMSSPELDTSNLPLPGTQNADALSEEGPPPSGTRSHNGAVREPPSTHKNLLKTRRPKNCAAAMNGSFSMEGKE